MKIVLVCTGLNDLGGTNRHLSSIYKHLTQKGFEVHIICCSSVENRLREYFFSEGIRKEHLRFIPHWKKRLVFPAILSLAYDFGVLKPDIAHSFGIQSDIFCGLAVRFSRVERLYAYFESQPLTRNSGQFRNAFYRLMNILVKDKFLRTIAVSFGVKNDLIDMSLRQEEKISVIYLGVEVSPAMIDFEIRSERLRRGSPAIGAIARFSPEKGLARFLRAATVVKKQIPEARFVLIGNGRQKNGLEILAQRLNLKEEVEFRNWTLDPVMEMGQLDLFVMPSLREGCPRALLEALSVGCPVVASDIPGINEIIRDQEDGILADTDSEADFAGAIISSLLNPQHTIALAKNGYNRVREQFTIQKEMESLELLYK